MASRGGTTRVPRGRQASDHLDLRRHALPPVLRRRGEDHRGGGRSSLVLESARRRYARDARPAENGDRVRGQAVRLPDGAWWDLVFSPGNFIERIMPRVE